MSSEEALVGGVWAGITGPDDFHQNVNNNAFTLCAVSLAIHWARYYSCLCERNERDEVPDEYIQKALYLNLPYDNIKRLHYAHEGFNPGRFFLTGSLKFVFSGWVKNRTFSFYYYFFLTPVLNSRGKKKLRYAI